MELSRRLRHRLTIIERPSLSEAFFANTLGFRLTPARLLRKESLLWPLLKALFSSLTFPIDPHEETPQAPATLARTWQID